MHFSVWPINEQPFVDVLAVAQHAEATGWDGVWVADHLMPSSAPYDRTVLECWTTAAALLSSVPRLRVGTLVTPVTLRQPAVIAKMAATLDHIHTGRVVLGIGAGWQAGEHVAFGLPFPDAPTRLDMLDEACEVIRRLLREDVVSFAGRHYQLQDATLSPRSESIPLLVGVKGERRALAVAAKHADVWNIWRLPATFETKARLLDVECTRIGRDPRSIRRSVQALLALDGRPCEREQWEARSMPILAGSVAQVQDLLGRYADAGADEIVIPDFNLGNRAAKCDTLEQFVTEIAGEFRAA
jgi:alkanesulfonate monooxygenase SsuD/methylene tetrahydromethanopterin reductase-like flavin-dependent oxidoreductase (luciferase family)